MDRGKREKSGSIRIPWNSGGGTTGPKTIGKLSRKSRPTYHCRENRSELYESIGERGPKIGGGKTRVIAHTSYVLTWDRKFDRSNNACTILSATPKLKITYTLPKPSQKLNSPVKEHWETFSEGIRKHELVHGDHAKT